MFFLIKNIFSALLEIIFPRFCLNCKKEGLYICYNCLLFLSESGLICPVCQKPSYFGKVHKNCNKRQGLDGLISIWDYEGIIKKSITEIKEKGHFHILKELMEHILICIKKDEKRFFPFFSFLLSCNGFVFIPLYNKKKKQKGFDHCEILANHFSKAFNKKTIPLLKRTRNTDPQRLFNKKERRINIKDAFVVNSLIEMPEKIVLVDDFWESGATMKECARLLKKNGVKEIWGFSLARTP